MFQVNQLSGFGGALQEPLVFSGLSFKGRGAVSATGISSITAGYGTIDEGSAPVAGDVVVWQCMGATDTNITITDLTGQGWVQSTSNPTGMKYALQAKVAVAGDISSPPTLIASSAANQIMAAYWAAFSVSGPSPTLAIADVSLSYTSNFAPVDRSVDSSALNAPAVAVTCVFGSGDDGSVDPTGITLDKSQLLSDIIFGIDVRFGHKLDAGGAAYTIAKGDDGGTNGLGAGYISAS